MTQESKLLIGALGWAVAGKTPALSTDVEWKHFLFLARRHMLEPLVYDGLRKAGVWDQVPEAFQKLLAGAYMQAVYQDSQREYVKARLQEKLTEENIAHIFLKGSCLKDSYPVPALRTMCDMDVLVYTKDYKAIDRVAAGLGGQRRNGDGNHKNYSFPGGVSVEFHPNLLHHATPVGTQINPGWQYAIGDTCAMELTPEGFYLNTLCHLANHFVAGGVGVRFVLDVWVNRHLRRPAFDRTLVEKELESFGLLDFARKSEDLAELWFGEGETSPLLDELGEYILTSGSHGTSDRAMLNAVSLSPGGSRFSALMKKAFYPRAELEDRFPWCRGKPLLLPVAWCARAYNAVTQHGNVIVNWSKITGRISKTDVIENQEKLRRFGIHKISKPK